MNLKNIFDLNAELKDENKFTRPQWEDIINVAFSSDRGFNNAVEYFYIEMMEFDYVDAEDLITDIQNGDGDAFERFIGDIVYFYEN